MALLRPQQSRSIVVNMVLTASLSALYVVFRVIPTFPMFAVPGATFRAGDFVAPLYGIVLGPLIGPLAIALGTFVGFSVGAPPVFLGLDFLPAAVCAAMVGLTTRNRRREALVLNGALIVIFLLLPFSPSLISVGDYRVPYVWLHLVGLALLASPLAASAALNISRNWSFQEGESRFRRILLGYENPFLSVLVLALAGTLAQHMTGGIITQTVIGLNFHLTPRGYATWQDFWTFIFWLYPPERAIITVVATLIAAPAVIALKFSRLSQRLPRM